MTKVEREPDRPTTTVHVTFTGTELLAVRYHSAQRLADLVRRFGHNAIIFSGEDRKLLTEILDAYAVASALDLQDALRDVRASRLRGDMERAGAYDTKKEDV